MISLRDRSICLVSVVRKAVHVRYPQQYSWGGWWDLSSLQTRQRYFQRLWPMFVANQRPARWTSKSSRVIVNPLRIASIMIELVFGEWGEKENGRYSHFVPEAVQCEGVFFGILTLTETCDTCSSICRGLLHNSSHRMYSLRHHLVCHWDTH